MIVRWNGAAGPALLTALLGGCGDGAAPAAPDAVATASAVEPPAAADPDDAEAERLGKAAAGEAAPPCLMQDGKRLQLASLRAIGTEPFWGARIEGRCVTYSHPEDQQGTRIWTHYAPRAGGGIWSGALGGKPFELGTRVQPGCSDGMSDKVYPIAVELVVQGERRTGCAEEAG